MEKLKIFLAALKRQHFWVFAAIVVLLGLIAWNGAAGTLSEEFDSNSSKITSLKNELETIARAEHHPNESILEGLDEQTNVLKERVRELWQEVYDKQREEVLYWPTALGDNFAKKINTLKFADTDPDPKKQIPVNFRERYQNYVRERFEELPGIVKARKISDQKADSSRVDRGFAGERGLVPAAEENEYLVDWQGQAEIQQKLVWDETPSSLLVWVTQEDLWAYETLLHVIKYTNEASKPGPPSVSVIAAIDVGREAAVGSVTRGRVLRVTGSATGGEGDGEMSAPVYSGGEAEMGNGRFSGENVGGAADTALLDGRYLNAEGVPRKADEPDEVPEFKRLPVRMVLEMDERAIPQLLVQCANASLPVEVHQVRINEGRSARGTTGGGAARGGEEGGGGQAGVIKPKVKHDVVTIQGVIYIFNPPDKEKLEIVDEPAEGDPAATIETPADAVDTPTDAVDTPADAGDAPADGDDDPTVDDPDADDPTVDEPAAADPEAEAEAEAGDPAAEPVPAVEPEPVAEEAPVAEPVAP